MSDNHDWRRRKAEELGLVSSSSWISRPLGPSAPAAGAAPPRAQHADGGRTPAQVPNDAAEPVRKLSDILGDAMFIDRRRRPASGKAPRPSSVSPVAASLGPARHRWGARAAGMLAVAVGIALAVMIAWWLRGESEPADLPRIGPTTATPSSGAGERAVGEDLAGPNTSAASVPEPEAMVDATPELAPARMPPDEAALATRPVPRAEMRARLPESTDDEPALRPDRLVERSARAPVPRGRFTAPRAVAAPGRDFSPSFNCRRATSWVNRMVCNDEALAALDVQMSDAYGDAIAAAGPADERHIDADQARFLEQRARCRTAACVDRAYRIRVDELARLN